MYQCFFFPFIRHDNVNYDKILKSIKKKKKAGWINITVKQINLISHFPVGMNKIL